MERVNKKGGLIIVYPALDIIQDYLNDFLKNKKIEIIHKKVNGINSEEGIVSDGVFTENCSSSALYRTIFFRKNISSDLAKSLNF